MAKENNSKYYCDSNQWNMFAIEDLVEQNKDAIYIVMNRHYSGIIQSLQRSYRDGFEWAGKDLKERAELWNKIYSKVDVLPKDKTVFVSYDNLCKNPKMELSKMSPLLLVVGNLFQVSVT
jgi:hypothetical protein